MPVSQARTVKAITCADLKVSNQTRPGVWHTADLHTFNYRFNPKSEDLDPEILIDQPDPQLAEFQRIAEANRKGDGPPRIPVFDPNLHPEAHNHPAQEEVRATVDQPSWACLKRDLEEQQSLSVPGVQGVLGSLSGCKARGPGPEEFPGSAAADPGPAVR